MRLGILMIPAAVFVLARAAAADTTWVPAGNVSGEWNATGSPYMIQGDVTGSLNIGPGVTVFFTGFYGLSGSITALGAEGDSVYFTTDTLTNPARWKGLQVSGFRQFHYCVFEFVGDSTCAALKAAGGQLQLQHCSFRFNQRQATYCQGAGLYLEGTTVYATNCAFINCKGPYGGAAAVLYFCDSYFDDCLFQGNQAHHMGGAVDIWEYWEDDTTVFRRCQFLYNRCDGDGGAVGVEIADPLFEECIFIGNSAGINGGAIYGQPGPYPTFVNCTLIGNQAGSYGGGMDFWGGSPVLRNCLIAENSANWGGGVSTGSGSLRIERCTIVRNTARSSYGGGLSGSAVWLTSSIVAFNLG